MLNFTQPHAHTAHYILHFSSRTMGDLIHRYKKRDQSWHLIETKQDSGVTTSTSENLFVLHNMPNDNHKKVKKKKKSSTTNTLQHKW